MADDYRCCNSGSVFLAVRAPPSVAVCSADRLARERPATRSVTWLTTCAAGLISPQRPGGIKETIEEGGSPAGEGGDCQIGGRGRQGSDGGGTRQHQPA
jgi:hypothetical protein